MKDKNKTKPRLRDRPATVGDLHGAEYNPRRITSRSLSGLQSSQERFGDISGLVYNLQTGRLIGGNQRKKFFPDSAPIVDYQEMEDAWGTVAYGFIEYQDRRWPIRFVWWDESMEKAANLAANCSALTGEFTSQVNDLLEEVKEWNPELYEQTHLEEINVAASTLSPNKAGAQPPPKMAWALVAIPLVRYGEIAPVMEELARVEGIFLQTTVSNQEPET